MQLHTILIGGFMQKIYVISTCTKIYDSNAEFHFRGYLNGVLINKIIINHSSFERNEAYLLELSYKSVKRNVLYAQMVKYKKLFSP
jgi:hypothetical protein